MIFYKQNNQMSFIRSLAFVLFVLLVNASFSQQTKITSTGSAGNYSITYPGYFSLSAGQEFTFEANHTNTGAATLNVSSTGANAITKTGATSLAAGDIVAGQMIKVVFDGNKFQLLSATSGTISSSAWSLTGNSGTNAATNYIGTSDAADLVFKTSLTERMRLNTSGFLGVGTQNPQTLLHIEEANPVLRVKSTQSTSFASAYTSYGRDDGFGNYFQTGFVGLLGGGDFLTVGSPQSISLSTNFMDRVVITNTGNVGINQSSPSEVLDVVGNLKLAYSFMPGGSAGNSGDVLVSQGYGNPPIWQIGGMLTGGTMNYIPKWNSATSLSSTSLLFDNGSSVGVNTSLPGSTLSVVGNLSVGSNYGTMVAPANGAIIEGKVGIGTSGLANEDQFVVHRQNAVVGPGYSNIYAQRSGNSSVATSGTSWAPNGVDAGIKSYSYWGNNYSAAIAGYNFLTDFDNAVGVIGGDQGGGVFGALGYRGVGASEIYAGYFNGKVKTTGDLNFGGALMVNGNAGAAGTVLQSNGAAAPSWVSMSTLDAANKALSNLNATSINQSLNPNANNSLSLGTSSNSWKDLFLDGRLYIKDVPWTSIAASNAFLAIGMNESITSGLYNVALGSESGGMITTGNRNTAIGNGAGKSFSVNSDNTLIGALSGGLASSLGNENTFVGAYTGYQGTNSGNYNTFLGMMAGQANTTGSSNTHVGHYAGYNATLGIDNTSVGKGAGANLVSGSYNVFIGSSSGLASATQRNRAVAIGYNAKVDADNAMVLGGTGADAVKVGIGTTTPGYKLSIHGTAGSATEGPNLSFVTSADAYPTMHILNYNHSEQWVMFNASYTGSGFISGSAKSNFAIKTNLYGTNGYLGLDYAAGVAAGSNVSFSTALAVLDNGNVGIGTTAPSQRLEVSGNIEIPAANDYSYSSGKAKYFSMPAASFSPYNGNGYAMNHTISYAYLVGGVAGSTGTMIAPVNLPDGATVTGITAYVYDNDATVGYNISVNFNSITHGSGTTTNYGGITTTDAGTSTAIQTFSDTFSTVVNNSSNAYLVFVNTRQNNALLRLYSVKVNYTVTKAD